MARKNSRHSIAGTRCWVVLVKACQGSVQGSFKARQGSSRLVKASQGSRLPLPKAPLRIPPPNAASATRPRTTTTRKILTISTALLPFLCPLSSFVSHPTCILSGDPGCLCLTPLCSLQISSGRSWTASFCWKECYAILLRSTPVPVHPPLAICFVRALCTT
jgi:hypothetical protein